MILTFQERAVQRIDSIMTTSDYCYERPADLLADIIHYLNYKQIDFPEELETAEMYVTEEESMDEEIELSGFDNIP
jgi:hypothetical protein